MLLVSFYWIPEVIFISFIPLLFACYKSGHAFKCGFLSGFAFGAGLLYWVLVLDVPVPAWLWLGVILIFIYFGLVFGFSMWFSSRLMCFHLIPVIWTSIEFIRSLSPEIGFPWGSIGYALVPVPWITLSWQQLKFVQFAEFVGLPGITFFIMLINTLLFYTIKKRRVKYLFVALIILGGVWFQGHIALKNARGKTYLARLEIGVIQPNVAPETKRGGEFEYRLSLLYRLSKKVDHCDLLVWPESAIPGYLNIENLQPQVSNAVNSLNTPVIMGSSRIDFSQRNPAVYNSCFLVAPYQGVKGCYDKIYLVPFGERLPFDEIFPGLRRLQFGQGNFSPGKNYKVFDMETPRLEPHSKSYRFSTLICFESIFPRISRKFVRNGAHFLVNITDDCWFGKTPGPYQHAQQAVLRAIEYRVTLVRCGNTGISFFVDPTGEVESTTEIFTQKVITKNIPLRNRLTLYARWGDWFAWICVAIFFLAFNLRMGYRKK